MEKIQGTCPCGANFSVISDSFVYVKDAYKEFLKAHEGCLKNKPVIDIDINKENKSCQKLKLLTPKHPT